MRNILYILAATLAFSLFPAAPDFHPAEAFFTIQAGTYSHNAFESARRQALQLARKLGNGEPGTVRIEEGSRYYIVRVGRFRDMASAEEVFGTVKTLAEDAFILKDTDSGQAKVLRIAGSGETPLTSPDESYALQTGKFQQYEHAREKFDFLIRTLVPRDSENLRIIVSGDFYRIRIGRFPTSAAAEELQGRIRDSLSVTNLVKVNTREEKIVDQHPPAQAVTSSPGMQQEEASAAPVTPQQPAVQKTGESEILHKLFLDLSTYYSRQEYGKAAEMVRKGLARWPDNPDLHAWYGAALLATGFPDKAYEAYRKAAALQPDVPEYHSGEGHSLLDIHIERARSSVDSFRKALTIDPNNVSALEGLGILYVSTGRRYLAAEVYEHLKQLDQNAAERLNQFILYGLDWGDTR